MFAFQGAKDINGPTDRGIRGAKSVAHGCWSFQKRSGHTHTFASIYIYVFYSQVTVFSPALCVTQIFHEYFTITDA